MNLPSRLNVKNSTELICSILRELPVGCTIGVSERASENYYGGKFVKIDGHKVIISNPYNTATIPHWHPYKVDNGTIYLEFDAVMFNFHHSAVYAALMCAKTN